MRLELDRLAAQTEAIEEVERALRGAGERGFPEEFQARGKAPAALPRFPEQFDAQGKGPPNAPSVFPESFEAKGKAVPNG